VILKNQPRADVLNAMLSANRGFVAQQQGRVWVTSSRPLPPQATMPTIDDGMLAGPLQYRSAQPKKSLVNKVRTQFVAPDRDYTTVDGPILVRADLQALDGEVLEQTISLPFTSDHRRAQRLAKGYLLAARLGRTISTNLNHSGLGLQAGMAVRVSSAIYPIMDGDYLVQTVGYPDDFSNIAVTLVEYDPTINGQWDPTVDEQDFTIITY
jgi:hypothetical protein